jgi:hypothetical protein
MKNAPPIHLVAERGVLEISPVTVIGVPACTVVPCYHDIFGLQISRGECPAGQGGSAPARRVRRQT